MLKSYLTIALRNLRRHTVYSVVNIAGLAVGLAACLLILIYVRDDLSYDRHHEQSDRIYRVTTTITQDDDVRRNARSPVPLGPTLEATYPSITDAVRFWRAFQPTLHYGDKHFREEQLYFADPAVFDVFTLPLATGDPATVLSEPHTVVLTESTARRYFGDGDPIGQVLRYEGYPADTLSLMVTGVLRDLPHNTHLDFDLLVSLEGIDTEADNWGSYKPIWTYVLLPEGHSPTSLEAQLPAFVDQHLNASGSATGGKTLHLEPITEIHLYSRFTGGFKAGSSIAHIYLFSAIGLLILLIACINFTNLATAQSMKRAREVGMRKVLGAHRTQLVKQFLGEAVLLTVLALGLAVALVQMLLPSFNALAGKAISSDVLADGFMPFALLVTALVVSLLAGSYPAFFLAGFRPLNVLKGSLSTTPSGTGLRKGLVVFQFVISIALIIATGVVFRQIEYVHHKPLGFTKDHVVVLPYSNNEAPLTAALRQHPSVQSVSVSQRVPVNLEASDGRQIRRAGRDELLRVESYLIDEHFLETYQIDLVAGRALSPDDRPADAEAFLINEAAAQALGYAQPEEALGQQIEWSGYKTGPIVGVVHDFHMKSMHEEIEPQVLHTIPEETWWRTFISARIESRDVASTLHFLEETWRAHTPDGAYEYFFIDESLEQLHRADVRFGRLISYFAVLAVAVACLGLFGLAAFAAEQRTKEIGVRKVLGATAASLVALLSKDFLKLVGVAFVIAAPVAYVVMQRWLQDFAYRTDLGIGLFLIAGALALGIALVTVSYQAVKAALADPVESLRYE